MQGKKLIGQRVNRGLTYWEEGENKVIFLCFRHFICALDAKTGQLINSFGDAGRVDMRDGLGRDMTGLSISAPRQASFTKTCSSSVAPSEKPCRQLLAISGL
jgi:glucose dehydrogenase